MLSCFFQLRGPGVVGHGVGQRVRSCMGHGGAALESQLNVSLILSSPKRMWLMFGGR